MNAKNITEEAITENAAVEGELVLIAHFPTPIIERGGKLDDGTWAPSTFGECPTTLVIREANWTKFLVERLHEVEYFEFARLIE